MQIQFFLVRMRTSNNFTYIMGSHAMQFGNLRMQKERAGDYEGTGNTGEETPGVQEANIPVPDSLHAHLPLMHGMACKCCRCERQRRALPALPPATRISGTVGVACE